MWAKNVRYLDYNASSGVTGSVRQKLTEFLSRSDFYFANPSSSHRAGQQSQQTLMRFSMKIAQSLGKNVESSQLVFVSSGTEANQTVIRSAIRTADLVIIGVGEHSASYDLLPEISSTHKTVELPLLSNGQYDLGKLSTLLSEHKDSNIFLSLFWANNETGVLTQMAELEGVLRASPAKVILHLDGAQAWGKIEVDPFQTPASFITFSGHKIGAPAGVGVIWLRPGQTLRRLSRGTENLLGIAALSFAAEEVSPAHFSKHTTGLRDQLEAGLKKIPAIKLWGTESARVPNTVRFSIRGFENYENWVQLFDLRGFAVSHGSACKSQVIEPSRVLLAMGAPKSEALNAVRISFGLETQPIDVDEFLVAIQAILGEKNART